MMNIFIIILALVVAGCTGVPTQKINPSWSPETVAAVHNQALLIGMTQDQVVSAWGRPENTAKSVSANATIEVWQYGTYHWTSKKHWLSFVDGKLVRIRE